jgi:hypothetical protein
MQKMIKYSATTILLMETYRIDSVLHGRPECRFHLHYPELHQSLVDRDNLSLRESTAPLGHLKAQAVPAYRLNNFPSPKRQSISALGTDPGQCVPGLPLLTQTIELDALQLEIYSKYRVFGDSWAGTGRHGISVITLVPC